MIGHISNTKVFIEIYFLWSMRFICRELKWCSEHGIMNLFLEHIGIKKRNIVNISELIHKLILSQWIYLHQETFLEFWKIYQSSGRWWYVLRLTIVWCYTYRLDDSIIQELIPVEIPQLNKSGPNCSWAILWINLMFLMGWTVKVKFWTLEKTGAKNTRVFPSKLK